jgi:hypothetical protein
MAIANIPLGWEIEGIIEPRESVRVATSQIPEY